MRHLAGAFGPLVDRHLHDPFLRNWVDLLCFLISGMPMGDTNAAAMATLFGEWFSDNACLDYPVGGSAAVVDALVRGLQRHGGELQLGCTVDRLIVDGERCTGVHCDDGRTIAARHVVSNADVWSTIDLVPETTAATWKTRCAMTQACASFLHLHLGFDANGLDDLPVHMGWVGDWERGINAPANARVFSIPSFWIQAWPRRDTMFSMPTPPLTNLGRSGKALIATAAPTGYKNDNAVICSGPFWNNGSLTSANAAASRWKGRL